MTGTTAKQLAQDLRSGRRDPLDLVAEVYDRIDSYGDAALFIRLTRSRAEAEARASRDGADNLAAYLHAWLAERQA